MSFSVCVSTGCKLFLKAFASPRSALFFFGLMMGSVLAITDSFKRVYEIWGMEDESTTYPNVITYAYFILYITYLHMVTIPPIVRNMVLLLIMFILTALLRFTVFCASIPMEKIPAVAISSLIGWTMAIMMFVVDFWFVGKSQKNVVAVVEIEDD